MCKPILLVIFGIITGSKLADIQSSAEFQWNEVITSNLTIRYFKLCWITVENVKTSNLKFVKLWHCTVGAFFWDTRYTLTFNNISEWEGKVLTRFLSKTSFPFFSRLKITKCWLTPFYQITAVWSPAGLFSKTFYTIYYWDYPK